MDSGTIGRRNHGEKSKSEIQGKTRQEGEEGGPGAQKAPRQSRQEDKSEKASEKGRQEGRKKDRGQEARSSGSEAGSGCSSARRAAPAGELGAAASQHAAARTAAAGGASAPTDAPGVAIAVAIVSAAFAVRLPAARQRRGRRRERPVQLACGAARPLRARRQTATNESSSTSQDRDVLQRPPAPRQCGALAARSRAAVPGDLDCIGIAGQIA